MDELGRVQFKILYSRLLFEIFELDRLFTKHWEERSNAPRDIEHNRPK